MLGSKNEIRDAEMAEKQQNHYTAVDINDYIGQTGLYRILKHCQVFSSCEKDAWNHLIPL